MSLPTGGVEIAVDGSQRGRAECTYRGCGFYTTGIGVSIHRGGGNEADVGVVTVPIVL